MLAVIHSRRTPQLPDSPPHSVVWGLPRVGAPGDTSSPRKPVITARFNLESASISREKMARDRSVRQMLSNA